MGYTTRYEVKIHININNTLYIIIDYPVIRDLRKSSEAAELALDEEGNSEESINWSNHNVDLLSISEQYPLIIFELIGEGEVNGDMWKKYYQAGKLLQTSKAIITFKPLDITLVK